jgi:hypothetical protein
VRELELSGGVRSLPQVPLVERRQASAPEAEGRRKPPYPWRALCAACVQVMEYCVCRRSASFLYLPEASRKELLRNNS